MASQLPPSKHARIRAAITTPVLSSADLAAKSVGPVSALWPNMTPSEEEVEHLTDRIISCGIEVHRTLGPGLLESVYRECMMIELRSNQLRAESDRRVMLEYKGQRLNGTLQIDLLVEDCIVVELKAVERIHPVHLAQAITYLKLTGFPAGLVMNFNEGSLRAGLRRVNHPDRHAMKTSF